MITRFAPSPTGHLHLGHVYAAKVAHALAANSSGQYLVRFEDIDTTRIRPEFYSAIEKDLQWLGLYSGSEPLRQSNRTQSYADILTTLRQQSAIYPCFCTRKDIQRESRAILNAPHGPEGSHYPGTCRRLSPETVSEKLQQGLIPSWRLDTTYLKETLPPLSFIDHEFGEITVDLDLLGDVILARKDIGTSYHIAVVADDAWQGITNVTRGNDLIHSTHIHRTLQHLLNYNSPSYLHHRLINNSQGKRLAKRDDAYSISQYRADGLSPNDMLALLPPLPSF